MGTVASQITSLTIVYSSFHSGAHQRKHQSSASLAFVRGIHRWPMNSPHKGPVTRKMFPFDDVIMVIFQRMRPAAICQLDFKTHGQMYFERMFLKCIRTHMHVCEIVLVWRWRRVAVFANPHTDYTYIYAMIKTSRIFVIYHKRAIWIFKFLKLCLKLLIAVIISRCFYRKAAWTLSNW